MSRYLLLTMVCAAFAGADDGATRGGRVDAFSRAMEERAARAAQVYAACPYSALSRDFLIRFSRDPEATPGPGEVLVEDTWRIAIAQDCDELTERMAGHFAEFLGQCMGVAVPVEKHAAEDLGGLSRAILLLESGGGKAGTAESFTISARADGIAVCGDGPRGLRDGIVKLLHIMGLRGAPLVAQGEQVYEPRIGVRLGKVPLQGTHRDLVFMGYNAVITGYCSLFSVSQSDAIPELAARREPEVLERIANSGAKARRYGLKTYIHLDTRDKFEEDDPVLAAHPETRGTRTWKEDGEFTLCTEHPLVQQYLADSVVRLFQANPGLDGIMIIIGGEGFYHCHMRAYGAEKGHTTCARCEALGAETVVANLCNRLAAAARTVNPNAEVVAWPYSAAHVWSADPDQVGFIEKLGPGVTLLTEIEKDEVVSKDGLDKTLWDYSIDLVGPGKRAERQIAACVTAGVPVYLKSESELSFEASRLPHVPCLDRWFSRFEALAGCGANGAWVWPYFRPCYGATSAELGAFVWWEPATPQTTAMQELARRVAGDEAGPHLRRAWEHVSRAIERSPQLPPYFKGPHYLGPLHPMCADKDAEVPEVFYGQYRFYIEISPAEAMKLRPTFETAPTGDAAVLGKFYREMEACLAEAVSELDTARPLVPERCAMPFGAENAVIRWFYHTTRTQANFCESCLLRDRLATFAANADPTAEEREAAATDLRRWREVLLDERENAVAARPVVEDDTRLDFFDVGQHAFAPAADMLDEKLSLLDKEIEEYLPRLADRCDLKPLYSSDLKYKRNERMEDVKMCHSSYTSPVESEQFSLKRLDFMVDGASGFAFLPEDEDDGAPTPWVWYAPALTGSHPGECNGWMFRELVAAGVAVCGVDVGESYGSPRGRAIYTAFYEHVTSVLGLSEKACLLPQSRGGLMLYNWAAEHPDCVRCIAGIFPVCDLRCYPGLDKACEAYEMTEEALEEGLAARNPVDRLAPLADEGVPIFHVHGDADTLVPIEVNSAEVARRYRALGGDMELLVVKGAEHEVRPEFFECLELVEFIVERCR